MSTDYPGIDYGFGKTNIDRETGIRFGVINMNCPSLHEFVWDYVEPDYGEPACPECGNAVTDCDTVEDVETADDSAEESKSLRYYSKGSCADFICESCKLLIDSSDAYGDEPNVHVLDGDGYAGYVDSYNDLLITKSPYYTHAQFCSPCAPGAGHLENACESGPKTYCLGHDWFQKGQTPYPVYEVATGKLVEESKDENVV